MACEVEEGGRLDAGRTPSTPLPVPWLAGCGGNSVLLVSGFAISGLAISALATSTLLVSALATTALEVSGTSGRAAGTALVTGVAGWTEQAPATLNYPALASAV